MIEFKGVYRLSPQSPSLGVLVQFDGLFLHVWHLSEPFHRLVTCDRFDIHQSDKKALHIIRLANGARVETCDKDALQRLAQRKRLSPDSGLSDTQTTYILIAVLVLLLLLLGAWLFATGKLPF